MSLTKSKIIFNEIIENTVTSKTSPPEVKKFEGIREVIDKFPSASMILKKETMTVLTQYQSNKQSEANALNTLSLLNYSVNNCQQFRETICDDKSVKSIKSIAKLDVCDEQ